MSLDECKKKIENWLLSTRKVSVTVAKHLMDEYELDFEDFLSDGLSPEAAETGMIMHLL